MRGANFGRKAIEDSAPASQPAAAAVSERLLRSGNDRDRIRALFLSRVDPSTAAQLDKPRLGAEIERLVDAIATEEKIKVNEREQRELASEFLADMVGLGPLEPLIEDEQVTDILVNGPNSIYVERKGKLERTAIRFRDNQHVVNVAQRIASSVGRRVDESSPMVDARLADGSRVNIVVPPLALDGVSISIRKFAKRALTFEAMLKQGNVSLPLARTLEIAAASRLNVLISGGTGSGKTTLLNAMSRVIDHDERIVTIEDAAELQLQQPHVVRLETRPANLEGKGEISQRGLLRNALRMRPDRIVIGEVRGAEAIDMLQAMNTGHDGSMSTIHSNSPRDALMRLENMVLMGAVNLPSRAVRAQIVGAINLVVQVERMRDGIRRVQRVTEVIGLEGEVITTQDLFEYRYEGEGRDGLLKGRYEMAKGLPHFMPRAAYHGLDAALLEALSMEAPR
jgi:pilus assembly protein CpaF